MVSGLIWIILTLEGLGIYFLYETSPKGQAAKNAKAMAQTFEGNAKKQKSGETIDIASLGFKVTRLSLNQVCCFTFYGFEFKFNLDTPIIGIAVV